MIETVTVVLDLVVIGVILVALWHGRKLRDRSGVLISTLEALIATLEKIQPVSCPQITAQRLANRSTPAEVPIWRVSEVHRIPRNGSGGNTVAGQDAGVKLEHHFLRLVREGTPAWEKDSQDPTLVLERCE